MKRMKCIIGTLILVVMVVFNLSFTSNAYTEEEKQQAKAWLSAHGYSPDMGGANQAYQDYLNGKFDEELGVDVNGDGIPASTEAITETSEESSTEETTEKTTESDEEDDDTDNTETDEDAGAVSGKSSGDAVKDSDESAIETSTEEDQSTQENAEEGADEEIREDGMDESADEKSTLYQPEKEGQYQEAAIVIVLAAILMLVAGVWLKYRK